MSTHFSEWLRRYLLLMYRNGFGVRRFIMRDWWALFLGTEISMRGQHDKSCADCGGPAFNGRGPRDGWQLEDGRTVCHSCCVADTHRVVSAVCRGDRGK